jgi:hypothetical protein
MEDQAMTQPTPCETCDELRKQIAALSKIDEKGMGHDDAISSIASHVHEIQVLCDAFGYDPSQWLQDEVANDCAAPQAAIEPAAREVVSHWDGDRGCFIVYEADHTRLLAAEREAHAAEVRQLERHIDRMANRSPEPALVAMSARESAAREYALKVETERDQLQQEVAGLREQLSRPVTESCQHDWRGALADSSGDHFKCAKCGAWSPE